MEGAIPVRWEAEPGALVPFQGYRQDWKLTSSGVGLNYIPPLPLLPPYVRSTVQEPLPPGSEKSYRDEVIPRLTTTSQLAYGFKNHSPVLTHDRYFVADAHNSVHYIKDLKEKLRERAWRFPLTMGNQKSEMRDRFPGWPNLPHEPTFHAGPQPFGLAAHHSNGASKSIVASTRNEEIAGKPFYVRDKAVLRLNEPYMSITTRDFHPFTKHEVLEYLKENPQARYSHPLIRQSGPMRDIPLFPRATRVPRLPPNIPAVPHRGLLSQTKDSYQPPNDHKRSWDRYCPVEKPPTVSCRVPVVEIMCVPRMYETEYKCYGSGKFMPV
ncbi:stabilizer of axonemal microtubules 3 isoform X1 [Anolis sagrei]|uniref:stabilizer of axonemal microtubules 3 isoform X1 n=1 Tax=Anolis sagrei TaxID=38937 RepID=UPI0035218D9D